MVKAPDAVQLLVVGSSDAFNAAGRANASYWLEGPGLGPLMVDFGPTALLSLRRLGREPQALEAIVVTHLHGDHTAGLPFLIIDAMFSAPRTRPLRLVGPVGLRRRLDALLRVMYGDIADRERDFELEVTEIAPGERCLIAGADVTAFAADHMDPPEQPLCLRITAPDGEQLAFSGDTAMCDGLRDAARGVDLLVAECSSMRHPCGRHCAWQDWLVELETIDARQVLLTHLGAEVRAASQRLALEAPGPARVLLADDGMIVPVT
jgi:ribonuclease BN (tRNA processing enzyme)